MSNTALSAFKHYSCGCLISRSDPACLITCPTHRSLIRDIYLDVDIESDPGRHLPIARPILRRQHGRRPHVVDLTRYGVEPNPGPPTPAMVAAIAATVKKTISNAVKQASSTKKKKKKSSKSSTVSGSASGSSSIITAPVSKGVRMRFRNDFKLAIPFSSITLQLLGNSSLSDVYRLSDGVNSSGNQGSGTVGTPIGLFSGSITGGNNLLACLNVALTNIAKSFAHWRISSLKLRWVPTGTAPTTTPGSITFAVIPDPNLQAASAPTTFAGVASMRNSVVHPMWDSEERDMTQNLDGVADTGHPAWKFCDFNSTGSAGTDAATERQQCVGTLLVATSGGPAFASAAVLGVFELSGILEFRDLAAIAYF